MKIAIHHRQNSFSESWISYCEENNINYSKVNCFDNNIIETLKSYDVLLWHWHHTDAKAKLFAETLMYSSDLMGLKIYPNYKTTMFFDDKIKQKYIFEALSVPFVKTSVFYNYDDSVNWLNKTSFPKVFKLKGGAGASNVKLIQDFNVAKSISYKMFNGGIKPVSSHISDSKAKIKKIKSINDFIGKLIRFPKIYLSKKKLNKMFNNELGYTYFQEFLPNNKYDIRIIIISDIAFGIKRMNRKDDFRASGSGNIDYSISYLDKNIIKECFRIKDILGLQSVGFDLLYRDDQFEFIEMCHVWSKTPYYNCEGYWNRNADWINSFDFKPENYILEQLLIGKL